VTRPGLPLQDLAAAEAPLEAELLEAVQRVVRSRRFILGDEVAAFERELAAALGVPEVVGVSSGTDALEACLRAAGVGAGDEVVMPALSFIASAEVVLRVGARPRFVDVAAGTPHARPEALEAAVTPRTRAVMAVHLFGDCVDLGSLRERLQARGVLLFEDAAQAVGSRAPSGAAAGAQGDAAALSFFPAKPLGGWGDGGAVLAKGRAFADRVRSLRQHGRRPGDPAGHEHFERLGGNWRLDALQAAVLRVKLPHLPSWILARQELVTTYDHLLAQAGLPVTAPAREPRPGRAGVEAAPPFYRYVLRARHRDALRAHLRSVGIETAIHYDTPLPLSPLVAHLGHGSDQFPAALAHCQEALALPFFVGMDAAAQEWVIGEMAAFYRGRTP
jgi:dTDP-4-amino-4,6-dideoxygalactose transaminase